MPINPLNDHYAFTTPASVFDEEALTALELAGRTAAKTNECVEQFNGLERNTTKAINNQNAEIERRMNKQDGTIDAAVKEIPNVVDNAIDTFINDGEFEEAVNLYIGDLEERVDNLFDQFEAGDTTSDAEIVDARLGDDGIVYDNLRESIRGQIKRDINATDINADINRFDPGTVAFNHILDSLNGEIKVDQDFSTSDYIPVKAGEVLHFNANLFTTPIRYGVFYAENKQYISSVAYVNKATVPEGAVYMRISFDNEINPADIMVTRPYYGNVFIKSGDKIRYNVGDGSIYKIAYGNRYNPEKRIDNAYVSGIDGRLYVPTGDANFICSDLIPILEGETLKLRYPDNEADATIRFCAGYDENFNFVGGAENVTSFTQVDNIKYVRFTIKGEYADTAIICGIDQYDMLPYGEYTLKGLNTNEKQVNSMLGGGCTSIERDNVSAGATFTLYGFPATIKKNLSISFHTKFSTFTKVIIGQGKVESAYGGLWYAINSGTMEIMRYTDGVNTVAIVQHGLTISSYLNVFISYDNEGIPRITLTTNNGVFTHTLDSAFNGAGRISVTVDQLTYKMKLTASCSDFSRPLWAVGDSYFGFGDDRVMGQLNKLGYGNFLVMGKSGMGSPEALEEIKSALQYGTPKYLIWYMGMNDGMSTTPYEEHLTQLRAICDANNITLIVNKVPSVPDLPKENIHYVINNSGLRFIDSHGAVGSNPSGVWIEGALSDDNVHPTEEGARILAAQMLHDVPEIMSYGRVE